LDSADYNSGAISPNGNTIALTKTVVAENPILVNKVLQLVLKVGYLVYNFFAEYILN
jgi:hypothetical protein